MSTGQYQKHIPKDTIVFSEGEFSVETYLLLKGGVDIIKDNQVVASISDSGTFIGEMSTLLSQPRSATVKTNQDSDFIVIKPMDFEKIIGAQPSIAFKLCKVLATRLHNTTEELIKLKSNISSTPVDTGNIQIQKEEKKVIDHAAELEPESAPTPSAPTVDVDELIKTAHSHYKSKELDKAIEVYLKVLEIDKENLEVLPKLSNAYFSNGNKENAIKYMKNAVDIKPDNTKLRNNLAVFYYKNGQKDMAIQQWEEIVKLDPQNEKALKNLKKLK